MKDCIGQRIMNWTNLWLRGERNIGFEKMKLNIGLQVQAKFSEQVLGLILRQNT